MGQSVITFIVARSMTAILPAPGTLTKMRVPVRSN